MEGFRCCYYLVIWIDFTGTGAVCVAPEGSPLLDIKATRNESFSLTCLHWQRNFFVWRLLLGKLFPSFSRSYFLLYFSSYLSFLFCFFSLLKRRLCDRNPWAITFGVVHFHQESHYSCDSLYLSDTSVWGYSSQLPTLVYSLARNSQNT